MAAWLPPDAPAPWMMRAGTASRPSGRSFSFHRRQPPDARSSAGPGPGMHRQAPPAGGIPGIQQPADPTRPLANEHWHRNAGSATRVRDAVASPFPASAPPATPRSNNRAHRRADIHPRNSPAIWRDRPCSAGPTEPPRSFLQVSLSTHARNSWRRRGTDDMPVARGENNSRLRTR